MSQPTQASDFWSQSAATLLDALGSGHSGLEQTSADERLKSHGRNTITPERARHRPIYLFLERFRNPLLLILVFATLVALVMRDWLDAVIVLVIIFASSILSFLQEYRASNAVENLRKRVSVKSTVRRGGHVSVIPSEEIVPGDIVLLSAGSLVPADGILIEADDFFVSQSLLTGEMFPVEKQPGVVARGAALAERSNSIFMGTSVRSGSAVALIVHTGRDTVYGEIADTLALRPPETEFEQGLRNFSMLLVRIMLMIVFFVLSANILLHHPTIETILFAMALAVGLSPELLPVILTVTLARGAQKMAQYGLIVKRLNAIENLGSMDVFCADKTGTLTKGIVQLDSTVDINGNISQTVLRLAYLNSFLQTGLVNPLDEAVITSGRPVFGEVPYELKLEEIPYDFVRKRLSIAVATEDASQAQLITKGALRNILDVCDQVRDGDQLQPLDDERRQAIEARFVSWGRKGYRVLGIAEKTVRRLARYSRADEHSMIFMGFLLFFDPPEEGVRQSLDELRHLGVRLKIITGDNRYVARHVAESVGIRVRHVITGSELDDMKDEALWHLAPKTSLFVEVDPNQKERIITALQKTGHVVGYLGDGINDAPALQAADVGVSVDHAVDVAKDAADFVLLTHSLEVLRQGIEEGRHTFANTLKYIFITTSANFGNMISMAMATLFLPFLPMLAKQILLNNLLSDVPSIGIAGDNVDRDWERTPHRWNITLIRNFMIVFGLVSTAFDLLTFGVLVALAGEVAEVFRTGWFVESLLTELCILFVIRTYQPFYRSRPSRLLAITSVAIGALALLLPYLTLGALFDFVPLPPLVLLAILLITVLYVIASEATKRLFYRLFRRQTLR